MQRQRIIDAYQDIHTDPGNGYQDDSFQGFDFPGNQDNVNSEGYPYGFNPQYPEDQMETLYIYTEDPYAPRLNKHQVIALAMGCLAIGLILALCFALPSSTQPVYTLKTISVQAHFYTQVFNADIAINPTGKKEYPATKAKGTLVIYNGSFLAQQLPANLMVTASNGVTFATDYAITIPGENTADSPPSNGIATVTAHAVDAGSQGNVQAGAINAVYGSSLFIKNLAAFTNGRDAYTETYATNQDKQNALDAARQELTMKKWIGLQAQPCTETIKQTETNVSVSWQCQYASYRLLSDVQASQVASVRVQGDKVILVVKVVNHVVTNHFAK